MRIDKFEFQDRNGNEIEPTKNQLVVYVKSLHKQIAELEKQLEEKDEKIEKLREGISQCEADRKCEQEKKNLAFKELRERSEQLRSQPAEIVEKIKKQIFNHFNVKNMEEYENLSLIDGLFTADAVAEILDTILKDYQK